jgi:ferredoxin
VSDHVERRIGDLTITADRGTCIAADNCTRVAPEVFTLDDSNLVTLREDVGDVDRERLLDACRSCPVEALRATDADGKTLAP